MRENGKNVQKICDGHPGTVFLIRTYTRLLHENGDPGWWPGDSAFEIAVGAILTQNTSWENVEVAIGRLKGGIGMAASSIIEADRRDLEDAVRSTGYYRQKADYLLNFCRFLEGSHGGSMDVMKGSDPAVLREELLSIRGIGEETADSILCYGLDLPVFVIDAYTRRLLSRLCGDGFRALFGTCQPGYVRMQKVLHDLLCGDSSFYKRYHALIVLHCKDTCRRTPNCGRCAISDICSTGSGNNGIAGRSDDPAL